jgi:hypothetical protein
LGQAASAEGGLELLDTRLGQQRPVELLVEDQLLESGGQRRQLAAVDDLPAGAVRQGEVLWQFGIGQDDDVIPAQPALRPSGVAGDEVSERIARFAGLADGLDRELTFAALLPPVGAVVPDLAARR